MLKSFEKLMMMMIGENHSLESLNSVVMNKIEMIKREDIASITILPQPVLN